MRGREVKFIHLYILHKVFRGLTFFSPVPPPSARYDYDLNIDANLNTLALLEPIVKQLEDMSPEEKASFRLRPGLGGQSITIYERIIRKVYEEERGNEIIELLYSHPAKVVPIVAKRLALKDEEWRKAQVRRARTIQQ